MTISASELLRSAFFFFFSNSVNVKSTGIHVMIQC